MQFPTFELIGGALPYRAIMHGRRNPHEVSADLVEHDPEHGDRGHGGEKTFQPSSDLARARRRSFRKTARETDRAGQFSVVLDDAFAAKISSAGRAARHRL